MFTVIVETNFKASHQLSLPNGSKESLHQHNWKVSAGISTEKLNKIGLVMDFHRLKAIINGIICDFAGGQLAQFDYFRRNNPSAENVAKYIYEKLQAKLPKGLILKDITVTEEPGCSAKFEKKIYPPVEN